jgi:hypothetical protein
MGTDILPASVTRADQRQRAWQASGVSRVANMKRRQASKIRELGEALIAEGFVTLDEQAKALGLARSTTWTILAANHKNSGLSAMTVNRMLASPQLPPLARSKILEYVEEKAAGAYGGNSAQWRRFSARLIFTTWRVGDRHKKSDANIGV